MQFTKGAALFQQSTQTGSTASSPSLNWLVYVFTVVPTGADPALNHGQYMHRLHKVTVSSVAHTFDLQSDKRLAMLFEGSFPTGFGKGRGDRGRCLLDAPTLFETRASSRSVSPKVLQGLTVSY